MTKIDIVSGFLGAGKTTLIKKLLKEALAGQKVVLIENEFGEIGIDGGFLKESGIEIREMNAGCICCSLVGDFATSLKEVMDKYAPERILIEPSGVGKLSDVMRAIEDAAEGTEMVLNSAVAVVDGSRAGMYIRNFGEFFENQISYAGTVILTRQDKMDDEKLSRAVELIRGYNKDATIITTALGELDGKVILDTIEKASDLQASLLKEVLEADYDDEEEHEHHHHHHDHDDDDEEEEHEHHHHHDHDDDDEEEHEHHHHHHDHDDDDEEEHEHHHHHHHHGGSEGETFVDENGVVHHHGEHDADEVFTSWGIETPRKYTKEEIESFLGELKNEEKYGFVIRSKGMVPSPDGEWIHFDYVPGEQEIRTGAADVTGKICVIGADLKDGELDHLFTR